MTISQFFPEQEIPKDHFAGGQDSIPPPVLPPPVPYPDVDNKDITLQFHLQPHADIPVLIEDEILDLAGNKPFVVLNEDHEYGNEKVTANVVTGSANSNNAYEANPFLRSNFRKTAFESLEESKFPPDAGTGWKPVTVKTNL